MLAGPRHQSLMRFAGGRWRRWFGRGRLGGWKEGNRCWNEGQIRGAEMDNWWATYRNTRRSFRPVRSLLSSTGSTGSTFVVVGVLTSFTDSVLGLGSLRESWVLTTVRVSTLEKWAPPAASFSGMRGVGALLVLAVGADEPSIMWYVCGGGEKDEGRRRGGGQLYRGASSPVGLTQRSARCSSAPLPLGCDGDGIRVDGNRVRRSLRVKQNLRGK